MANVIEVGKIVRLKSGGCDMTVVGAKGDTVECAWFYSTSGELFKGSFPVDALLIIK